jgi:hypothetical protein
MDIGPILAKNDKERKSKVKVNPGKKMDIRYTKDSKIILKRRS